jgi:hypothetical protein
MEMNRQLHARYSLGRGLGGHHDRCGRRGRERILPLPLLSEFSAFQPIASHYTDSTSNYSVAVSPESIPINFLLTILIFCIIDSKLPLKAAADP